MSRRAGFLGDHPTHAIQRHVQAPPELLHGRGRVHQRRRRHRVRLGPQRLQQSFKPVQVRHYAFAVVLERDVRGADVHDDGGGGRVGDDLHGGVGAQRGLRHQCLRSLRLRLRRGRLVELLLLGDPMIRPVRGGAAAAVETRGRCRRLVRDIPRVLLGGGCLARRRAHRRERRLGRRDCRHPQVLRQGLAHFAQADEPLELLLEEL